MKIKGKLVEFVGSPGVGKTYLAKKLEEQGKCEAIISGDYRSLPPLKKFYNGLRLIFDKDVIIIYFLLVKDKRLNFKLKDIRSHLGLFNLYLLASRAGRGKIIIIDQGLIQDLADVTQVKDISKKTINYIANFLKKNLFAAYFIEEKSGLILKRRKRREDPEILGNSNPAEYIKKINENVIRVVEVLKGEGIRIIKIKNSRFYHEMLKE